MRWLISLCGTKWLMLLCVDVRRFPKARVWPALQSGTPTSMLEAELTTEMPPLVVQERLLDLYFTYVHPMLPVIHKQNFQEGFRTAYVSRQFQ